MVERKELAYIDINRHKVKENHKKNELTSKFRNK